MTEGLFPELLSHSSRCAKRNGWIRLVDVGKVLQHSSQAHHLMHLDGPSTKAPLAPAGGERMQGVGQGHFCKSHAQVQLVKPKGPQAVPNFLIEVPLQCSPF